MKEQNKDELIPKIISIDDYTNKSLKKHALVTGYLEYGAGGVRGFIEGFLLFSVLNKDKSINDFLAIKNND